MIVLPNTGQQWTNPESNELHEILPVVTVNRARAWTLKPYRPLLQRVQSGPHCRVRAWFARSSP